jgi:hypothetical protein
MAPHLAIEDAPHYLDEAEDSEDKRHDALPRHPDDYSWGASIKTARQALTQQDARRNSQG